MNLFGALEHMDRTLGGINRFTSGSAFSFTSHPNNYGGQVSGGNIALHGWEGSVPYQNYYHEIGHLIDNVSRGYFTSALNARRVSAPDGTYVMGGPSSSYQRSSLGYAQPQILDPTGRLVDAQQHPGDAPCQAGDDWCASGNTASEEWADLVANYAAGNFITNPSDFEYKFGISRLNWIREVWFNFGLSLGDRAFDPQ
jgi:hypothetical protein